MGCSYGPYLATFGVYPDRALGSDRHHRSADFLAIAGSAEGPGSSQSHALLE